MYIHLAYISVLHTRQDTFYFNFIVDLVELLMLAFLSESFMRVDFTPQQSQVLSCLSHYIRTYVKKPLGNIYHLETNKTEKRQMKGEITKTLKMVCKIVWHKWWQKKKRWWYSSTSSNQKALLLSNHTVLWYHLSDITRQSVKHKAKEAGFLVYRENYRRRRGNGCNNSSSSSFTVFLWLTWLKRFHLNCLGYLTFFFLNL